MSRRKGEISAASVDRLYPHQVAIDADMVLGLALDLGRLYPSMSERHINVYFNDHWYSIYCFSCSTEAAQFCEAMHGIMTSPKERRRGKNWANWQPANGPPPASQWEEE